MDVAGAVDGAGLDQHVLGFPTVCASVHAQRSADRARYATVEREAGDARIGRRARELGIGYRGSGPQPVSWLDPDLRKPSTEADDHTCHPAVAHQQIGAEPNDDDRNCRRQLRKEVGKISLVRRREQQLRGSPDTEPSDVRQRRVRNQPSPQLGHASGNLGPQIGKAHAAPPARLGSPASHWGSACAHSELFPAPKQMTISPATAKLLSAGAISRSLATVVTAP